MLPALREPRGAVPRPVGSIRREVDQLFDRFFGDLGTDLGLVRTGNILISLWEDEQSIYLAAELPGVKKDDLELTIENSLLYIVARRSEPDEDRQYWVQERQFGRIERAIDLPESVDPDSIDAELRDGVLCVTLRKRPESQPTRVEVRS